MTPGLLSRVQAPSLLRPLPPGAAAWAGWRGCLVTAAMGLHALTAQAQSDAAGTPAIAALPAVAATAKTATSKPLWASLTAEQQAALQPLAPHWNGISEPHKRKWLALSRNYGSMTPEDQATLHSRMTEWSGLSSQQRALARLNFAEVKRVPADERKAKWEAYQALSPEERRKLAESAKDTRPHSVAVPVRPVPARKLAPVPSTALWAKGEHMPRIELAPPAPAPALTVSPVVPAAMAATAAMPSAPDASPATSPPVPPEAQVPAPNAAQPPVPAEQRNPSAL
jgi:hypothetical protein